MVSSLLSVSVVLNVVHLLMSVYEICQPGLQLEFWFAVEI